MRKGSACLIMSEMYWSELKIISTQICDVILGIGLLTPAWSNAGGAG